MARFSRKAAGAAALGFAVWTVPAMAHPGHEAGLADGIIHPLTGFDHLAAMVAVGLLGVRSGGERVWQWPLAFVTAMLAGSLAGLGKASVTAELAIVASLLLLAFSLIWAPRIEPRVALAVTAIFGFAHGWTHGGTQESLSAASAFLAGALLATIVLHAMGIALGRAFLALGPRLARAGWTGAGIATGVAGMLAWTHIV